MNYVLIGIVVITPLVLIPLALWIRRRTPQSTRDNTAPWWLLFQAVWTSVAGWLRVFDDPERTGRAIVWAVLSLVVALSLLVHVANWNGWGRRLYEASPGGINRLLRETPPYRQPSHRQVVIGLPASVGVILSNLALFAYLLI